LEYSKRAPPEVFDMGRRYLSTLSLLNQGLWFVMSLCMSALAAESLSTTQLAPPIALSREQRP